MLAQKAQLALLSMHVPYGTHGVGSHALNALEKTSGQAHECASPSVSLGASATSCTAWLSLISDPFAMAPSRMRVPSETAFAAARSHC